MMFKKGSFEIGGDIYPVAIKVRSWNCSFVFSSCCWTFREKGESDAEMIALRVYFNWMSLNQSQLQKSQQSETKHWLSVIVENSLLRWLATVFMYALTGLFSDWQSCFFFFGRKDRWIKLCQLLYIILLSTSYWEFIVFFDKYYFFSTILLLEMHSGIPVLKVSLCTYFFCWQTGH